MNTYRGFTIVKHDRGSHRWHAEMDGARVEFPRGKIRDAAGTVAEYQGAYFTTRRDLYQAIDRHLAESSGVQRFESGDGREPIEVSRECPAAAIRWLLGNVHVGTPVEEVEAEIRRRVNVATDPRWTPEKIEEALRFARWEHAENRALYNMVA